MALAKEKVHSLSASFFPSLSALSEHAILLHIAFHGLQQLRVCAVLLEVFMNVHHCDDRMHLYAKFLFHFHNGGLPASGVLHQ